MDSNQLDIVYCVKDTPNNEELRYSLRSLKNIPHRKVFIYGGCPEWVNTDLVNHVEVVQNRGNKWLNTTELLKEIVKNNEITENFIWFNDDFFVLKPVEKLEYFYDRTLNARVTDFYRISWRTTMNGYCTRLKLASRTLKFKGFDTLNYELHLPIVFNREKLNSVFELYPNVGAKRSLYGNTFVKKAIQRKDVKIYDMKNIPDENWDFASTSDQSFSGGKVGKYIRNKFKSKCEYEKGYKAKNGRKKSASGTNRKRNSDKEQGISESLEKQSNT